MAVDPGGAGTIKDADTVAAPPFEVVQLTVRPVSAAPFASRGVAVSCSVPPTAMLPDAGLTVTEATGIGGTAVTASAAVPLLPSLVAVMVALPGAWAVTSQAADTVAAPPFEVVQLTVRPVSAAPFASWGVAVSCSVPPTAMLPDAGLT